VENLISFANVVKVPNTRCAMVVTKTLRLTPKNMSRLRAPPSMCVGVKNTKLQSVVVLKRSIINASNSKTIGANK
jgi:hypothetical protein